MINPRRVAKIPTRWTLRSTLKFYFSMALINFNHEHQRAATMDECRQLWQSAKKLAVTYDRRYSGKVQNASI